MCLVSAAQISRTSLCRHPPPQKTTSACKVGHWRRPACSLLSLFACCSDRPGKQLLKCSCFHSASAPGPAATSCWLLHTVLMMHSTRHTLTQARKIALRFSGVKSSKGAASAATRKMCRQRSGGRSVHRGCCGVRAQLVPAVDSLQPMPAAAGGFASKPGGALTAARLTLPSSQSPEQGFASSGARACKALQLQACR